MSTYLNIKTDFRVWSITEAPPSFLDGLTIARVITRMVSFQTSPTSSFTVAEDDDKEDIDEEKKEETGTEDEEEVEELPSSNE